MDGTNGSHEEGPDAGALFLFGSRVRSPSREISRVLAKVATVFYQNGAFLRKIEKSFLRGRAADVLPLVRGWAQWNGEFNDGRN